jgi:hypothetical protein
MRGVEMSEYTIWKIIGLAVALLTIAVPAYIPYDLYGRGPSPEKRLEISDGLSSDVLAALSGIRDRSTISITVEDATYNNLIIVQTPFGNIGDVPVLPSDYHKKLSVSVDPPWKIVTVENDSFFRQGVVFDWERITDTRFEA